MRKKLTPAEKIAELLKMIHENQITTAKDKRKFYEKIVSRKRRVVPNS
jgi:hypothetical protein